MSSHLRAVGAVFLLSLLVSGCAAFNVTSTVSRFHDLDGRRGTTLAIIASDSAKDESLEFKRYAALVASELLKYGLEVRPKDVINACDYILFMDYAIDMGKTITMSIPIYGRVGGGTSYQSGSVSGLSSSGRSFTGTYTGTSWSAPQTAMVGSIPYSAREFTRVLQAEIVEREALQERGEVKRVFEGRAISMGTSQLPRVMRGMVQALFERFPGRNGETFTTFYPPDD